MVPQVQNGNNRNLVLQDHVTRTNPALIKRFKHLIQNFYNVMCWFLTSTTTCRRNGLPRAPSPIEPVRACRASSGSLETSTTAAFVTFDLCFVPMPWLCTPT